MVQQPVTLEESLRLACVDRECTTFMYIAYDINGAPVYGASGSIGVLEQGLRICSDELNAQKQKGHN